MKLKFREYFLDFLLVINFLEEFVLWIHFSECPIQLEILDDCME